MATAYGERAALRILDRTLTPFLWKILDFYRNQLVKIPEDAEKLIWSYPGWRSHRFW